MNASLKRPTLETRCSHGGIAHGTPEYYAAIARVQAARNAEPSQRELTNQRYQRMQETGARVPLKKAEPTGNERTCKVCGNTFRTTSSVKMICSPPCQRQNHRQLQKAQWRRKHPETKPQEPRMKVCEQCKTEFSTIHPFQRFCSAPCRDRWHCERRRKGAAS